VRAVFLPIRLLRLASATGYHNFNRSCYLMMVFHGCTGRKTPSSSSSKLHMRLFYWDHKLKRIMINRKKRTFTTIIKTG